MAKVGFLKNETGSDDRPIRFVPIMEERFYSGDLRKNYVAVALQAIHRSYPRETERRR